MRKSENYGDAEFLDHLPRLIDLVPTRAPIVLVLALVGLAIVAGLEGLYYAMPSMVIAVENRVAAFDLTADSNLAAWFSSMTLAMAGFLAIVVYSVRRYRTNDYHGHYRVWLWAALCCFLISVDQTANLRDALRLLAVRLSGTPLYGDGAVWWMLAYGFLLGAIGTRLMVDVLPCRASAAALVGAIGCYGLIAACRFGWVPMEGGPEQPVMVAVGAQLLGNLLILAAIGLYARHAILDALGLLPVKKPQQEEQQSGEDDLEAEQAEAETVQQQDLAATTEEPLVVHPPHSISRPASQAVLNHPTASPGLPTSIEQAEATLKRKLTKAERKALRQRIQRMQAERHRRAG